jgi:D-methionine transport system permease protein
MFEIISLSDVLVACWETLYMVLVSTTLSYVFGLPLGIILVITSPGHIQEHAVINRVLGSLVNITRSIPFIIVLILLIPFTRFLVGTFIGTTASIVPLTIVAIPFTARLVETAMQEIDGGLIEAALSMGASPGQIIAKVLIPEALIPMIRGVAITMINLVGYSAMAGIVGGGGLGTLAYYYGYQRYLEDIMWITVVLLIIIVQGIQKLIGDTTVNWVVNRRR